MTEISICNIALGMLGAESISSLTENSKSARLCAQFYPPVLDSVLRDHAWNFASKRVKLAMLADTPVFGFKYSYQLPADCVKARELDNNGHDFAVEGRKLLTDLKDAGLVYTARIKDTTIYDGQFVKALASRLAADIAVNLTGSKSEAQAMYTVYKNDLRTAKLADSTEGKKDVYTETDWLKARL